MENEPQDGGLDDQGRNALHWAVLRDDVDGLHESFEEGLEVNASTYQGDTALHFAAWNNREHTLPVLLEHKADASLRNHNGNTPLDNALRKRHWGCALKLMEAWIPDLAVDKKGKHACHYFAAAIGSAADWSGLAPNLKVMFDLLPDEGWTVPDEKKATAMGLLSEGLLAHLRAARLEKSWEEVRSGASTRPRM